MAAANALLDALRVPRQVIVDDEGAELQVDAFGSRLGRDHDVGAGAVILAEVVDERGAAVHLRRAGDAVGAFMLFQPAPVDGGGVFVAVGAAEQHQLAGIAIGGQEAIQIFLRALGLREDDGFARRAKLGHLAKAQGQRFQQGLRLGVRLQGAGSVDEGCQLGDFRGDGGADGGGVWLRIRRISIGAGWRGSFHFFVGLVRFLFQVVLFQVFLDDKLFQQLPAVVIGKAACKHALQPIPDGGQGGGNGVRAGGQQFAQDERGEMALSPGQCVRVVLLQKGWVSALRSVYLMYSSTSRRSVRLAKPAMRARSSSRLPALFMNCLRKAVSSPNRCSSMSVARPYSSISEFCSGVAVSSSFLRPCSARRSAWPVRLLARWALRSL